MAETQKDPHLTPQQKLDRFAAMGLSDEQRAAGGRAADTLAARNAQNAETNQYRRDRLAADEYFKQQNLDIRREMAANRHNASAAEQRQASNQLMTLAAQERKAYDLASQLAEQISLARNDPKGTTAQYVDRNGALRPISEFGTTDAAIADMTARYKRTLEDAKDIIAQKNNILAGVGGTIGTSTADAWKKLDEGTDALINPKKEQAGPQQSQGGPAPGKQAAPPPAAPAAAPAAAKAAAPAAGKMRVKLSDGRTGTIDARDFDAKTMSKM